MRAQREPGQHETGGPPLGAIAQLVEPVIAEPGDGGTQQVGGLRRVEPEVGGADLTDATTNPHPAQPERRIGAGDQRECELRRTQVDQSFDRPVHVAVVDEVVVVEHDDETLGQRRDLVDERRHDHRPGPE